MARLLWTQTQDMGPSPRELHAMCYDSGRRRTVMFGGFLDIQTAVGDTWEWNGEYWTQIEDIGPEPRGESTMAYDAARGQTILFGGKLALGAPSGDTWVWDGQAWTQVADTGPLARRGASMAYDSTRERVVLFGGANLHDTWEWDGLAWTQVADDGPTVRIGAAMAYDSIRGRIVLFGGSLNFEDFLNDTWEFDGVGWTRIAETGPAPRARSGMVFAGTRNILFGGEFPFNAQGTLGTLNDTWEGSGKFWTQRQDFGPRDRGGHQMVYDSDRDRVVLFGGSSIIPGPAQESVRLNDTWELPGNAITLTALILLSPLSSDAEAMVSLSGPSPIGGIFLALSSSGPVEIPVSVFVAEGKKSAVFPVKPKATGQTEPVAALVTAKLGASSVNSDVQVARRG